MKPLQAITIPRWGMTMTEGTVCSWMAREGDVVHAGQELIEVETTKITNVIEAPGDGVLRQIVLAPGQTAPVGALAGVLAASDVSEADINDFIASYADRMGDAEVAGETGPAPRVIEAGGWRLNILEAGPTSDDAILLVHGFGGELKTWLFNQEALSAIRRVVAIDLPGHGQSQTAVGTAPLEGMAAALLAVIDTLRLGHVHLVGHSLGGGVAALAARSRPDVVRSLTLIAPIGLGPNMDGSYLRDFIAAQRRRPMQAVLERLYAKPDKITSEMVEDVLRVKRLEGVSEALTSVAAAIADGDRQRQDLQAAVAGLSCPVLLIWGEHDRIVPLAGAAPGQSRLEIVPDAGHMPQVEQAAAVNRLIEDHTGGTR